MIAALRARWRRDLFSAFEWQRGLRREGGEGILDGIWLAPDRDEAPYGAYLKPTCKCPYPAAAREKIAADLAFDLSVPAVPVLLYNGTRRLGCEQNECCVALVTHPRCVPWQLAFDPVIRATDAGRRAWTAARIPLAKIAVFDFWIGNVDRDNGGNLLHCEGASERESDGIHALDHSAAMGGVRQSWRGDGWMSMDGVRFPSALRPLLDRDAMLGFIDDLKAFPEEEIRACVSRIPDAYMDASRKQDVVNGLLGRRPLLAAFVLQYLDDGVKR